MIQQAGAIVFRNDGPQPLFLLVKARKDPTVWIFPKGHIEAGETAAETAVRETAEEAGVVGRIVAPIDALEFEAWGRWLHVQYFLVEYEGTARDSERRPFVWGTYAQTRDRLSFDTARELLAKANALIPT